MKHLLTATLLALLIPVGLASQGDIRVKLSYPEGLHYALVSGLGDLTVSDGEHTAVQPEGVPFVAVAYSDGIIARVGSSLLRGESLDIASDEDGYVELRSWDRTPAWDTKGVYNDNKFQGGLKLYKEGKGMLVVNELGLEDYMRGIAEVPESDQHEKRKALAVMARSYAAHYTMTDYRKFADERYDASDDPAVFQKYLGYGFTQRSPKWQQALRETESLVLSYKDEYFRAAYSSCTGELGRRKTPAEAGWSGQEYFQKTEGAYAAVGDPEGVDLIRDAKGACGHGVGLSGLGATKMAQQQKNFVTILDYYYPSVDLTRLTQY